MKVVSYCQNNRKMFNRIDQKQTLINIVSLVNQSLTKEGRQYNEAKTAFSTNGAGITGHPHAKKMNLGAPGWLSWLGIRFLISAQVMISGSWDRVPHRAPCSVGSLLLPLPATPPACALSLSREGHGIWELPLYEWLSQASP